MFAEFLRCRHLAGLALLALGVASSLMSGCAGAEEEPDFRLPPGFTIEVLVADVPNARSMALGTEGTLFVGTRREGEVYAVRQPFSNEPVVTTLLKDLRLPNGVAFRDGDLYVAEPKRVLRLRDIESHLDDPGEPEVVIDDLPFDKALHSWKYIDFGPDGRLYVPFGAPCNICNEPGFALIMSMNADGSDRRVFATGIRNSVGFDWHPETGEFWFSDNGRDMLGDDIPPCELNVAPKPGLDFGFPFCHGTDIADPEFGAQRSCSESRPPAQELAPHSAPLGVRFYTGQMFPAEYRNQVFIAEHGSWNRSKAAGKTGYRVTLVRLGDDSRPVSYEPFLEGFLTADEKVLGRPVDLLVAPDGSLLVSDDTAGVIYRISYHAPPPDAA